MRISGALIEAIVNLLRNLGLLSDPEHEADIRRQLADLEKTRAQVWVDFVRATSPDPARVYMWTNSLIALVRPAISTLIVVGMLLAPQRILELVRTFGEAGPAGWVVMAPVWWWFFGRDVNKVLAMRYGGIIPVGSGAADAPEPRPAPSLRGEAPEAWEGIARALQELNGESPEVDLLDPELNRPGDR